MTRDWTEKEKSLIVVVPSHLLFEGIERFNGFKCHLRNFDLVNRIKDNYGIMTHGRPQEKESPGFFAESDPNYKQPVPYVVIYNSIKKTVYVYERSKKGQGYSEVRLEGLCSLGVGGHIEFSDIDPNLGLSIDNVAIREIKEETTAEHNRSLKLYGYTNDESNSVNSVHFGIVYILETLEHLIQPKDNESKSGKMMSWDELGSGLNDKKIKLESWSEILLPTVRNLIS